MEPGGVDAKVRALVASGDVAGAATVALRALGPEVLPHLRSLLRDESAAADAFSRFSEKLWTGLPSFRFSASLRTWAFRIATHAAFDVRAEAWHRRRRRLATSEAARLAAEAGTGAAIRAERQRRTLEALRVALPLEERSLLALRVDRELSWEQVAEVLSAEGAPVDVAALMKRYERLKARLSSLARDMGLLD